MAAALAALPPGDLPSRLRLLVSLGRSHPSVPPEHRSPSNRVLGCAAQVWLLASQPGGAGSPLAFAVYSGSEVSRGTAALAAAAAQGLPLEQLAALDPGPLLEAVRSAGLAPATATGGGAASVLEAMKKRARAALAAPDRSLPVPPPGSAAGSAAGGTGRAFPSLLVRPGSITALGPFAEAQAQFLRPPASAVASLAESLAAARMGVVAHYYMDPEVQGVLASVPGYPGGWPHVHISDSLAMADAAVRMARDGCAHVAVLGVDFMADNVRAILDEAGFASVGVHRMSPGPIGCSLAEAADGPAYDAYLVEAAESPRSLHVVYINTSLPAKAKAGRLLPTVACTSGNVVQTILAAAAQAPGSHIWCAPPRPALFEDPLENERDDDSAGAVARTLSGLGIGPNVRPSCPALSHLSSLTQVRPRCLHGRQPPHPLRLPGLLGRRRGRPRPPP